MATVVRDDRGMYREHVGIVKLIKEHDEWRLYIDGELVGYDEFIIEDNSEYEEILTMGGDVHVVPRPRVTYV